MFVNIFVFKCCYFVTEFSNPVPTHNRVDLWRNLCTSLLYFVLHVYDVVVGKTREYIYIYIFSGKTTESDRQAITLTLSLISWRSNTMVLPRRKESSRSLSHLLMSFLLITLRLCVYLGVMLCHCVGPITIYYICLLFLPC